MSYEQRGSSDVKNAQSIIFIATSNPQKARAFYEKTLGLKFVSSDQFALVFDLNGIMLRIQIVENVHPHGYTALGWTVTDIKSEVRALSNLGVPFMRYDGMNQDENGIWTSPIGAKIAWFNDIDGNILSLTQF